MKAHERPRRCSRGFNSWRGGSRRACAKTLVAPLDRARTIIQDTGWCGQRGSRKTVMGVCAKVFRGEGVAGLFRGNAVSVMKVLPCNALQFAIFNGLKEQLTRAKKQQNNNTNNASSKGVTSTAGDKYSLTLAERARVRRRRGRRVHRGVLPARRAQVSGAFYTLVPIRPRRRGGRRSLRTFAAVSPRPTLAFNPRPRRLSTSTDAFQLHPDIRSYGTTLRWPSAAAYAGGVVAAAKQLYLEQGGIRAFYKGLGPTLVADVVGTALGFTLYDTLTAAYRERCVGGRKATPFEKRRSSAASARVAR